jgi:hypothetical protein
LIGLEGVGGVEFVSIEFLFIVVFVHIFIEAYLLSFVVAEILLDLLLLAHFSQEVILFLYEPCGDVLF